MDITKLKVKAILFDLDGTIVDSRDAYLEAAKTAFRTMDLEPPTMQTALQIPKRLEQNLPIDDLTHANTARFLDVYLRTFYAITEMKTKENPYPISMLPLKIFNEKPNLH